MADDPGVSGGRSPHLGEVANVRYLRLMASVQTVPDTVVRDPATGEFVAVRGVGALRGQLTIDPSIDLTRPIAAQTTGRARRRRKP